MDTKLNEKEQLFEKDNLSGENKGPLLPNQRGRYLTASSLPGDKVVNSHWRTSWRDKRNNAGSGIGKD